MNDTMSARQRIHAVLEDAYYEGIYSEHNGGPDHVFDESWVGTIIDIVREALLETDPLEAAADIWNNHHAPTCDRAITAALDAAFGDQQP